MNIKSFAVNLTSEAPEPMIAFYRDIVGLARKPEMGDGAFDAGAGELFIDGHSETKGPTKEPHRALIDFFVEDLAAEQKRLEQQGVQFIRTAGREEWGGVISTFLDPDGNYCQLVQYPQG